MAINRSNTSGNRTGTGFVNLARVLQANRDNRLGDVVTEGVQGLANKNQQELASAQGQFQQDLSKNQLNTEQNVNFRTQALNDANQGKVTDENAKKFQSLIGGNYVGPTGLQDYSKLQSNADRTQQLAGFTRTPDQTKALLQKFIGRPGYTQGQQTLDSTLLGQNRDVAKNVRSAALGVGKNLNKAQNVARQEAEVARMGNAAFGKESQDLINARTQAYNADMQAKAASEQLKRDQLAVKAKEELKSVYDTNKLSQDVAKGLNITPEMDLIQRIETYGQGTFEPGRRLSDYYQFLPAQATAANVQSAEDFAKINALAKLANLNASDVNVAPYLDESQVGQFAASPLAAFAKSAYEADIGEQNRFLNTIQDRTIQTPSRYDFLQSGEVLPSEQLVTRPFNNLTPEYQELVLGNLINSQIKNNQQLMSNPVFKESVNNANNLERKLNLLKQNNIQIPNTIGDAEPYMSGYQSGLGTVDNVIKRIIDMENTNRNIALVNALRGRSRKIGIV